MQKNTISEDYLDFMSKKILADIVKISITLKFIQKECDLAA